MSRWALKCNCGGTRYGDSPLKREDIIEGRSNHLASRRPTFDVGQSYYVTLPKTFS